jgi:hypothetical protein
MLKQKEKTRLEKLINWTIQNGALVILIFMLVPLANRVYELKQGIHYIEVCGGQETGYEMSQAEADLGRSFLKGMTDDPLTRKPRNYLNGTVNTNGTS